VVRPRTARWPDDLVDPVENVVGEQDLRAGKEVVKVLHGAGPEEGAGYAGVGDGECHGQVGHRQPCLVGHRD
jgi:hypothetical protein